MKLLSNGDAYADALCTAMIATIPFITLGVLGQVVTLYVAASLGILLLCGYLVRVVITILRPETVRQCVKLDNIMELLQVPYVITLSSLIAIALGYELEPGLWIALVVAIICILYGLVYDEE